MTGKLIFKMELFKIMNDKKYLKFIALFAGVNTIVTLLLFLGIENIDSVNNTLGVLIGVLIFVVPVLLIANRFFTMFFPFHILSMDYRNNVMAMMMASGVNRTKLFFAKAGAVILATIALFIALAIGPFIIIGIEVVRNVGISQITQALSSFFEEVSFNNIGVGPILLLLLIMLVAVLNNAVMTSASTILMKGKYTAILIYIAFSMANSTVLGLFFGIVGSSSNFESDWVQFFIILLGLALSTLVFGYIGLRTLRKQNL